MLRLSLIAAVTLSGCCTLQPGSPQCEAKAYASGWTHKGPKAPCADELLQIADAYTPAALQPLHGVIVWYPAPFQCTMTQKVWGCAPDVERSYVTVLTATAPHASDTALAEEVAHWIWFHSRPTVLTEEWRVDPATGQRYYWRDPEFRSWYEFVRDETRRKCAVFDQQVFK